jgi:hypothetical protein
MSVQPSYPPECSDHGGSIELVIEPRARDLGSFEVRRVLPAAARRMVGPFIFFDHMGPAVFPPGKGIAVRPHPHIGLATITYLFEGEIVHRDSLGYLQPIRAGAVNLMTAGRGVVHSERAGEDIERESRLHGIQSWTALPDGHEETDPSFIHYPAAELPELRVGDAAVRLIIGAAFGGVSPVVAHSRTLYLEVRLPQGATFTLPDDYAERAVYVVSGTVRIGTEQYRDAVMIVARPGSSVELTAEADSCIMIVGGEPLGRRHIWWNFVSSSKQRIEQAKSDWQQGRFGNVSGDDEFIPLPQS